MTSPNFFGITELGLFCLAVLLLNVTPGPDTAYIAGRSLAQGRRAGLISAAGISAGCCLHAVASALGLSALLAASATAFLIVKLAGGMYLIYLGLCMLLPRSGQPTTDANATPRALDQKPLPTIFMQALLTNLMNPKVILFFISFFPQFVAPDATHKTLTLLLLGAIFVVMSTCWNCGTALVVAVLVQRRIAGSAYQKWLGRVVGGSFIALGARLLMTRD